MKRKKEKRIKKKLDIKSKILIVLLSIRAIGQILNAITLMTEPIFFSFYCIMAFVYLIALLGVLIKKIWGSILTMIIALLDLSLVTIFMTGPSAFGALIMDLTLLFLGYKENEKLRS
jgi:hypothetical protein